MQQKIFIFGWARGVGNFFIVKKFAQPNSSWSSVIYAAYDYTGTNITYKSYVLSVRKIIIRRQKKNTLSEFTQL